MEHNKMAPTDDSRNKRQHILDAAHQVFSRKGFNRATVDEIIALADTGKGTVYNYFNNKEQLFFTLIKERSASFEAGLSSLVESAAPPSEKVATLIRLFIRYYLANADLWRVMMHEMRALHSQGQSPLPEQQREKYILWFGGIVQLMQQVMDEGHEPTAPYQW